ncbi:MAG: hypothetical protein J6K49_07065 [Clostridia bacterium]|nr:hypothetical protein [Clostridia bacterium]
MINKRNRYVIGLMFSFVCFFSMCSVLSHVLAYGTVTLNNTTEFTATVINVVTKGSGDDESIVIITEEYGDKLRVFRYDKFAETQEFLNIKKGEVISFRIENSWVEKLDYVSFVNIVQLRTETREVFSVINYGDTNENDTNNAIFVGVFVCFVFIGVAAFCVNKLYKTSRYYKKRTKPDWCKF